MCIRDSYTAALPKLRKGIVNFRRTKIRTIEQQCYKPPKSGKNSPLHKKSAKQNAYIWSFGLHRTKSPQWCTKPRRWPKRGGKSYRYFQPVGAGKRAHTNRALDSKSSKRHGTVSYWPHWGQSPIWIPPKQSQIKTIPKPRRYWARRPGYRLSLIHI